MVLIWITDIFADSELPCIGNARRRRAYLKQIAERAVGGHRAVDVSPSVERMRIEKGGSGAGRLGGVSEGRIRRLEIGLGEVDAVVAENFQSGWRRADIQRRYRYPLVPDVRKGVDSVVECVRQYHVQVLRLFFYHRSEEPSYGRRFNEYFALKLSILRYLVCKLSETQFVL